MKQDMSSDNHKEILEELSRSCNEKATNSTAPSISDYHTNTATTTAALASLIAEHQTKESEWRSLEQELRSDLSALVKARGEDARVMESLRTEV